MQCNMFYLLHYYYNTTIKCSQLLCYNFYFLSNSLTYILSVSAYKKPSRIVISLAVISAFLNLCQFLHYYYVTLSLPRTSCLTDIQFFYPSLFLLFLLYLLHYNNTTLKYSQVLYHNFFIFLSVDFKVFIS